MSPNYSHKPIPPTSTRVRCPVCRTEVYSPAGIHPQCAVRQADPPRLKARRPGTDSDVAIPEVSILEADGVRVEPLSDDDIPALPEIAHPEAIATIDVVVPSVKRSASAGRGNRRPAPAPVTRGS